jgi:hypothetical protein
MGFKNLKLYLIWLGIQDEEVHLKRQCHKIFNFMFFSMNLSHFVLSYSFFSFITISNLRSPTSVSNTEDKLLMSLIALVNLSAMM